MQIWRGYRKVNVKGVWVPCGSAAPLSPSPSPSAALLVSRRGEPLAIANEHQYQSGDKILYNPLVNEFRLGIENQLVVLLLCVELHFRTQNC